MKKLLLLAAMLCFCRTAATAANAATAAEPGAAAAPSATPPGKYVTVYGAKIHYVEAGTGPVLILLHGLADDTTVWEAVIAPLARSHRVIALDQIGFGRSDKPLLNYRVGTFVDFLAGFLKELGIERASLIGNSLGGWVAAGFALAHPGQVERLVLIDAAGFGALTDQLKGRTLDALRLATREDLRYLGPLTFYDKKFFAGDASLDAAFAQRVTAGDGYTVGRLIESMLRREDTLDRRLAAIRQPTLIVWGREDRLIPLAFGERFRREIGGSRLVVLDRCGHMPQVECATELSTALERFLGSP